MSAISELIERVEKATTGSRELDAEIARALGLIPEGPGWTESSPGIWHKNLRWGRVNAEFDGVYSPPSFTTSIDAALALVEAKLPGWSYGVAMRGDKLRREGCDDERAYAWLKNGEQAEADAPTLALALCLALLSALEKKKP